MTASQTPSGPFSGGCTCNPAPIGPEACTCGWGAFARRLESLANLTDPAEFVRRTGTLATDLDALLATRRPEAMRATVAACGTGRKAVDEAAEIVGVSPQRVYKLMNGTGRNEPTRKR